MTRSQPSSDSGHFDAEGQPTGRAFVNDAQERAAVTTVAGYRVIMLDSLIPGRMEGIVSRQQLDSLALGLAQPAEYGSVIVLHLSSVTLDLPLEQKVGLQDPAELAEVLHGINARIVPHGHFHL